MSIASEIERLINAKVDIKLSIENKGVNVDDDATLDDYPDYIDNIQTGTTPTGTVNITTNGTTDVTNYASANVNVQPNLQSKSETITTNTTTTITPDNGYDGLSGVTVTTNVSGGTTPTKGIVINTWNSNGFPTEVTTYGFTNIPNHYFHGNSSGSFTNGINKINFNNGITELGNYSFYYITDLTNQTTLPNTITTIGEYCFNGCTNFPLEKLPDNLTTLKTSCFNSCKSLKIDTIPDGVTSLPQNCFYQCIGIKKLSMSHVTSIPGSASYTTTFNGCTGMKKIWIGSAITDAGLGRYSLSGCTNLNAIYIDLPRATVEAFTNYQYAFMNNTSKTGIIICNDDNDFITKEQFDALVVN